MTRRSSFTLANNAVPANKGVPAIPTPAARAEAVRAKVRENQPNRREEPVMPDDRYLALLSIDAGIDIEMLAARPDLAVRVDEDGFRVLRASVAKAFLDELTAQRQADHEQRAAELEAAKARPHPIRERVRRLAARQRPGDDSINAFAAMIAFDDDNPLERSGRAMDEMLSGTMQLHKARTD